VNVEGITWHAIVLDPEPFAATKALLTETFGLAPAMEDEGYVLFIMPNGTMLELYAPQAVPDYGFNEGGVVFGFRVDDLEAASAAVEAAGCELLGEITRVEEMGYAYRQGTASTTSTSLPSSSSTRCPRKTTPWQQAWGRWSRSWVSGSR